VNGDTFREVADIPVRFSRLTRNGDGGESG